MCCFRASRTWSMVTVSRAYRQGVVFAGCTGQVVETNDEVLRLIVGASAVSQLQISLPWGVASQMSGSSPLWCSPATS